MGKIAKLSENSIIFLIECYRYIIRPVIGDHCRFTPSCSEYTIGCLKRYGTIKGLYYMFIRLCRCNPFHPGGYDPVEKNRNK